LDIGEPVALSQFPALMERYVIASPTRTSLRFMDEPPARFFGQTETYTLSEPAEYDRP